MANDVTNSNGRVTADEVIHKDSVFRYQLLDRLRSDCEYYLNYGNRHPKSLWAGDEKLQIEFMIKLHESFKEDEKPESSGHAFSGAKVLPWRNIQVPLRYLNTIFQQLSRFSIVHISRTLNTATIKFCPNSLPVSP